mgnify:CR=1 FL=1
MLLAVENISLNFGKRKILDDVSLEVDEGRIIAITGKSGGGKTSLLGIISGLLDPDAGRVLYKKRNILKWGDFKRSRFRNREIGFVFQFFNLLPDMTSYQNIRYPTLIKFFPGNVDREIREMAAFLNIEQILHQKPMTLSGGERQRVAIARAIINHPRLILADEPTGNLDVVTAAEIKNLFLNLKNREKMAIILVTHDQTLIEIADEHYHLENGKLQKVTGKSSVKKTEVSAKSAKRAVSKTSNTKNKNGGTKKAEQGAGKKSAVKAKIKK